MVLDFLNNAHVAISRLFMKTTTPSRNTGVALANPDSKMHLVTDTIHAYYANSNLGMAKSRNARLGKKVLFKTCPNDTHAFSLVRTAASRRSMSGDLLIILN